MTALTYRYAALGLALACLQTMAQGAAPAPKPAVAATASPPKAEAQIEQMRELLRQGKAVQVLPLARQAAELWPTDYRPPYYQAYALMDLGEQAPAAEALARSLALTQTAAAREAVEALGKRLSAIRAAAEAELALSEGLFAKAGRLYQEAFRHGHLTAAHKLVAAELFIEKLAQPELGLQLLRSITKQEPGTPEAATADRRLEVLRPQLQSLSMRALQTARAAPAGSPARAEALTRALALNAENRGAQLLTLSEAAQGSDWSRVEPLLKQLHRQGALESTLTARIIDLRRWQADDALRELLLNIWGDTRVAELLHFVASAPRSQEDLQPRMLRLPRGTFTMGMGLAHHDTPHIPERKVYIQADFEMGRTEVTFEQWDTCVAHGGCNAYYPEDMGWGRGDRPVINVSWHDAQAYVAWLSDFTGQKYRLPSEAEWEYAARAGMEDPPWSSKDHGNFGQAGCCEGAVNGADRWLNTAPVAQFPPNAFGLYDMIGNVWEWVQDCRSANYQGAPNDGGEWRHGKCETRTDRGGAWNSGPEWARPYARGSWEPNKRGNHVGFRVARTL